MTKVRRSSLLGLLLITLYPPSFRAVIHDPPVTQTVAAGHSTTFHCSASGPRFAWIIFLPGSDEHILYEDNEHIQGFTRVDSDDDGGHVNVSLELHAEGRLENNNTGVCCAAQLNTAGYTPCPEQHERAHLIVIGVPTEPRNLTVMREQGHLRVQWTAPYAHPGYPILSYHLQINNSESGSIQVELSGNTTGDIVNITSIGTDCDVLTVSLTAKNHVGWGTAALSEITLPIYVTNVSCDVHRQFQDQDYATVNVTIKFPQICLQQWFKYTLVLVEERTHEITTYESVMAAYFGTSLLNISLASGDIRVNSDYRLTVNLESPMTHMSSSSCIFSTYLNGTRTDADNGTHLNGTRTDADNAPSSSSHILSAYMNRTRTEADNGTHWQMSQVVVGCAGGLAVAALLLAITLVLLCICHKRRRYVQDTINRASNMQQLMAQNPIYDSPLYESVQEQLKPVFGLSHAQESLYTKSPVHISISRREEELCHSAQCTSQSEVALQGDIWKGEAGVSKPCDDDYMEMQSIQKKDFM